eukprot:TRINITY_DN2647_c0_g2_i1.p1 TRINITY_DN2647_c0_g2~~TRINITY_DN2647_c0_g2_i1.p1  ORF type:complete len:134 (+),score=3.63 TRINITY_DN2647_c0_g2_i1:803-1204(+)
MTKQLGHKAQLFPITQTNIQYDPKLVAVEARQDKGVPDFGRMPRKEMAASASVPHLGSIDAEMVERGRRAIDSKSGAPLFGRSKVFLQACDPFGLPRFLLVYLKFVTRACTTELECQCCIQRVCRTTTTLTAD